MQEYFSKIQDPRHQGYIKHKLEDILVIIMCAVLCGLDELCTIIEFAHSKKDFKKKHFNIEAIPSKPKMSRILTLIDVKQVAEIILKIMQKYLDVKGKIFTADAMHCQRETSKAIIAKKGDYVFGLKGN